MALNLRKSKPRDIVYADDLTIEWNDGAVGHYPFVALRNACPCAACVDEMTGKKVLDPKTVQAHIHIRACEFVGNYAIRITWSDGHDSGIFSFRFLRELHELAREGEAEGVEKESG